MGVTALPLDPNITTWVLVPIFVAMFVIAILQDNLRVLLLSSATRPSASQLRRDHMLQRAVRLRSACAVLPDTDAWHRHRAFFTNTKRGSFSVSLRESASDGALLKFTLSMLETWGPANNGAMMKQYALNFVPNILLGVFVNHFFSGFIVAKLPFSLPASFRYILHSGINLPHLDTCYVSSISWYVLSMLCVRSLASMVTEWVQNFQPVQLQNVPTQSPIMSSMLLGLPMMGGGGPSEEQMLQAERDNLHITTRDDRWLNEAEKRLLALK